MDRVGGRGPSAEPETDIAVRTSRRRETHQREIPRLSLHEFGVTLQTTSRRRREAHGDDELSVGKHRLAIHPRARQHEEFSRGDDTWARWPVNLDPGVERNERNGRVRRMYGPARATLENPPILI